jgi:hypothetical protein
VPHCAAHAVGTLRLLVEGYDAVLPVCASHGEWLCAYTEEDTAVRLLDRLRDAE